jgi:hypothetical protein
MKKLLSFKKYHEECPNVIYEQAWE